MVKSSANQNQDDQSTAGGGFGQTSASESTPQSQDETGEVSSSTPCEDSGPVLSVEEEVRRLEQELAVAHDAALRSHAELDNFRKRSFRELEDLRKHAGLPLMRDLLPVLDNLDRAIQAAEQNESSAGLLEGVSMVAQQLHSVLDQHQCKRIEAKGHPFDPNLHEAIGQLHCSEFPAGLVAEATTVGYELHGRVVRPSQVFVSLGPAEDQAADSEKK